MSQTTYPDEPAVKFAGLIARPDAEKISVIADAAIAFGRFVAIGTTDRAAKLPTSDAEVVAGHGFAVADISQEYDATGYAHEQMVTVLRRGYVYVVSETATTKHAQVYVRHTTLNLGEVRNDVDGGNAGILAGARFAETIAGAGLVMVEFFATI